MTKPTGDAFYRDRAAREATRPTDNAADHGTCDWGGCNQPATTWRHDTEHGWLPVCDKCSRTNWDTSEADAIEAAARAIAAQRGFDLDNLEAHTYGGGAEGVQGWRENFIADGAAAYAAIAPIVRRDVAEEMAECMEGAPEGIVGTNHRGCPCVKRGGHLAHRCRCGTEWWWTEPVCTCPLIDVTRIDGGGPEYVRGDPKGCDVHGGERKRADDEARRKARTA